VREDETADATRRTRLANERTYLAWWRTALTAFAVGAGIGKLVPELGNGTRWPYAIAGAGYAVLGVFFLAYGMRREGAVERSLREGGFAPLDRRIVAAASAGGIGLGVLTLVLVVLNP
jgi:putative membrane protein